MNLFKKATATLALVALVSGVFSTGVSAASNSEIDAANALAASGYIVDHSSDTAAYNLNQNVLRQEIAAVARGIAGLAKKTSCDGSFTDVTATTPNDWACLSVEALLDADLIAANTMFNPESNISKAEAVGMMVKAAFGDEYAYDAGKATSWQEQVVDFAAEKGVVASFTNYDTAATRGFVFEAGYNAEIASDEVVDDCDEFMQLMGLCDEDDEDTDTDTDTDDDTPVIVGDNYLMVELSAETPVGQNIPSTAANVEFMAFDVTAGSEDATLESIVLERVGLGARGDFKKVWLSQDGVVVSNDKTIASDDTVTIPLSVSITAGSTETFVVNASMNGVVSTVNAFGIVDVTASTSVDVATVRGNEMTTVSYTVAEVTLTPKGTASNIDAGEDAEILGEFKLEETATASKKDAILKSIRFKTTGGVKISDNLENITLNYDGSVVSTETIIDGDYVTFKLDDMLLEDAKSLYFEIKADVVSGDDGDTVAFSIKDDFDIYAIESGTAIGTSVVKGASLSTYTLNAGKVTLSQDTTTPSSEEYISDTDEVLAFIAKVDTDQTVLVDSLRLYLDSTSHIEKTTAGTADDTFDSLDGSIENVRVYVNDTLVDSVDQITDASAAADRTVAIVHADDYYNFDSSFELSDDDLIKVYVDVTKDVVATTEIKFKLNNVGTAAGTSLSLRDVEYVSDGETLATAKLTGTATSNVVEVVSSSAGSSIVRNDGFSSETFLAGEQGATLMKFVVNAGNSSSLEIKKLNFDAVLTAAVYSEFTNFKLLKDGSQVGGTEDLTSAPTVTITDINDTIPQGGQATYELIADIDTSAGSSTDDITLTLDASDSVFYDSNDNEVTGTIATTDVAGDTSSVKQNAILAAAIDGDTPNAAIVLADTTGVELAKYKFTATDGDINIKDLYFKNTVTGADSRISALKLVVDGSVVDSRVPSSDVIHFNLGSASKIVVPKNNDVVVSVEADFNSITSASQTDKQITMELTDIKADTAATSKALVKLSNTDQFDIINGSLDIDEDADVTGEDMEGLVAADGTTVFDILTAGTIDIDRDGAITAADDLENFVSTYDVIDGFIDVNEDDAIDGTDDATNQTVNIGIDNTDHYIDSSLAASNIVAERMYIRKTQPTVATSDLGTSKLNSGEQSLYKMSVTADSSDDVEVGSVTFNIAGTVANTQLIVADDVNKEIDSTTASVVSGMKLFVNDTEVAAADYTLTIAEIGTTNNFTVTFDLDHNKVESVSAGTSKTFELKATLAGVVSDDYVSVKMIEDDAAIIGALDTDQDDTFDNAADVKALATAGATTSYFIWSDNAGSPHTAATVDWFNGFKVNGLDTTTTTLTN